MQYLILRSFCTRNIRNCSFNVQNGRSIYVCIVFAIVANETFDEERRGGSKLISAEQVSSISYKRHGKSCNTSFPAHVNASPSKYDEILDRKIQQIPNDTSIIIHDFTIFCCI